MSKLKPLARRSDIVVQEFGNEILIYDLRENKAFNLNETSAIIWQLSNGDKTVSDIAENLTQKFNSPINEDFVWLALEQMRKDKLVENETEIAGFFEGVSRRDLIRKIGFASLVALPVISSLVAPMAINAQSTCAVGNCRCPNATTTNCPGSTTPTTINCNTVSGNNACDCVGPFGANNSAGPGFKTGSGCGLT